MPSDLARKLRITPNDRILVLSAPAHYANLIEPLPDGAELSDVPEDGAFDVVHAFVANRAELEPVAPIALRSLKPKGVLWFSYPKRASKVPTDITRDSGWELLANEGLRPIFQIAVDETWSALRFMPAR